MSIQSNIKSLQVICHSKSLQGGWWNDLKTGASLIQDKGVQAMKLLLIHSEISEAVEGFRKDSMDSHLTNRKSEEVELADALIRIFDYAEARGLDLGAAISEKMEYNSKRADHKPENRAAVGGKAF